MKWQHIVALLLVSAAVALVVANERVHSNHTFNISQMEDYSKIMTGLGE